MRMVVDKFGTGDKLLVYSDSVEIITDPNQIAQRLQILDDVDTRNNSNNTNNDPPDLATMKKSKGQIQLTRHNYDKVIQSDSLKDKLVVVKYGAIWCP